MFLFMNVFLDGRLRYWVDVLVVMISELYVYLFELLIRWIGFLCSFVVWMWLKMILVLKCLVCFWKCVISFGFCMFFVLVGQFLMLVVVISWLFCVMLVISIGDRLVCVVQMVVVQLVGLELRIRILVCLGVDMCEFVKGGCGGWGGVCCMIWD